MTLAKAILWELCGQEPNPKYQVVGSEQSSQESEDTTFVWKHCVPCYFSESVDWLPVDLVNRYVLGNVKCRCVFVWLQGFVQWVRQVPEISPKKDQAHNAKNVETPWVLELVVNDSANDWSHAQTNANTNFNDSDVLRDLVWVQLRDDWITRNLNQNVTLSLEESAEAGCRHPSFWILDSFNGSKRNGGNS